MSTDTPLWLPDGRLNLAAVDRTRFDVTEDAATGRALITPAVRVPSHPGPTPHAPRVPFSRTELWRNEGELWLRSIVVDRTGKVVSCGFPKFFELGEMPEIEADVVAALKASKVWLSPKLDGTLAIATLLDDGTVYWRTRGSLTFGADHRPEYAAGLTQALEKVAIYVGGRYAIDADGYYTAEDIVHHHGAGWSFLFELTGPCNEMAVVREQIEHTLTLLAAVKHPGVRDDFNPGPMPVLEHVYPKQPKRRGFRGPECISIGVEPGTELDLIRNGGKGMGEGFVLILPDARMVKVKTAWWSNHSYLLDRMSYGIVAGIVSQSPDDPAQALIDAGYNRAIHAKAFTEAAAYDVSCADAVDLLRAALCAMQVKVEAIRPPLVGAELRAKVAELAREVVALIEPRRADWPVKAVRGAISAALFAALDNRPMDRFVLALAMREKIGAVPSDARLATAERVRLDDDADGLRGAVQHIADRAEAIARADAATTNNLTAALTEVQAWQAATFGDRSPLAARLAKLRDEVGEFEVAAHFAHELRIRMTATEARAEALTEAADVLFVVADVLRALGATPADLAQAVRAKLALNRRRAWVADATGKFSGTKVAEESDR